MFAYLFSLIFGNPVGAVDDALSLFTKASDKLDAAIADLNDANDASHARVDAAYEKYQAVDDAEFALRGQYHKALKRARQAKAKLTEILG